MHESTGLGLSPAPGWAAEVHVSPSTDSGTGSPDPRLCNISVGPSMRPWAESIALGAVVSRVTAPLVERHYIGGEDSSSSSTSSESDANGEEGNHQSANLPKGNTG